MRLIEADIYRCKLRRITDGELDSLLFMAHPTDTLMTLSKVASIAEDWVQEFGILVGVEDAGLGFIAILDETNLT